MIIYDNPLEFCTYLTEYSGDKLPRFYIGSTNYKKFLAGYHGTVTSKIYKDIWNKEMRKFPHLFSTEILSFHSSRKAALEAELGLHLVFNVKKNVNFINMSNASVNGFLVVMCLVRATLDMEKVI